MAAASRPMSRLVTHGRESAASGKLWVSVASDAAGTHLVAASAHGIGADIWTSLDSGTTWLNETAGTTASGQQWARAPNGLTPVVKSRICVASLRCSSLKYVEYYRSSRLGPLATS